MNIGDLFFALRADGKTLEKDITKQASAAGDKAGATMGQSLSKSLNRNLGKGLSQASKNIQKIGLAAGALAIGGGIAAVKWAGEFEAQLNTINTIARETPEGLQKIGDTIRAIARDTGTPLEELTQGYYDLLSAGVAAADAPKVLAEANKLAIGGLASAAETVDLLTTAINVYGGDASKAGQFTDEFAKAIERGKVTAAELAGSYAQVAPLAKSLGVENKELAAGYATLTAAGTPAAEAATQMAAALTALLKKTPALEKLEKQTGKNYAALAGSKGLNVALQEMQDDAAKAGVEVIELTGRKEALLYLLQTTGPNLVKYNADLAAMGDAAGTAAAQMAERQQGLNFQLARAKALFKDAGITIGNALLPKLVPLIAKFNEFVTGNQEGIKRFGTDLANAFEGVAQWIAKLDFGAIANSLKLAGTFAKGIISAFLAAPQWLQAAVATGWGLNKLTGGMVGNIFGDLAKTAFGQFAARGASPANPLFVSDVAGGLSGPGGGKLGPLGLLLSASVAAGIIAVALPIGEAFADALPDEWKGPNGAGESESQRRIREGKEAMAREAATRPGNLGARGLGNAIDPNAGNMAARGLGNKLTAIDATLTAMQRQLHADLSSAIEVIKTSSDPKALAAAVETIIASIRGGAGSADTTNRTIADLSSSRDAALARGDTATAKLFSDAIGRLEPFAKGRQWQAEQIAEARKVVASNQTTAEKVAALKGIQADLLSHQRTMAAGIVGKLLDVEKAVNKVRIPSPTIISQIIGGGGSTPPKAPPKPGTRIVVPVVAKALGGPVDAGMPYWVGEHRKPELFVPETAGRIVPLSSIQSGGGSSAGGSFNPTINIQGLIPYRDPFEIATQLKRVREFVTVTPRRQPA